MNELDKLRDEFVDHMKCGRTEEAHRVLAERDELLLAELVTANELAAIFGTVQSAISNWAKRHDDFPAPRTGHGRTARYSRGEVLRWWAAHHPKAAQALRELEGQPDGLIDAARELLRETIRDPQEGHPEYTRGVVETVAEAGGQIGVFTAHRVEIVARELGGGVLDHLSIELED